MTREELLLCCKSSKEGVVVSCHVRPGASATKCEGLYGNALKLSLKAPPVDGKANKELCRFLAEKTGLPRSCVTLLSGETSREKRVLLAGAGPENVFPAFSEG
ncbi:MAG: DUF167 domain-containing protein [Lentisphaeria bacterium]|nr:DUF167 domain-containing protein [Lentisphaeria bacterium]